MIPRAVKGGIGQSNVWYANTPESGEHVTKVKILLLILTKHSNTRCRPRSHGAEGNPRLRAHIQRERNSKLLRKTNYTKRKRSFEM